LTVPALLAAPFTAKLAWLAELLVLPNRSMVPVLVSVPVRVADALEPARSHCPGPFIVTEPMVTAVVSVGSPLETVAS